MYDFSITLVDLQPILYLDPSNLPNGVFGLFGGCDTGNEIGKVRAEPVNLIDLEEEELLGLFGKTESGTTLDC